MDSQVNEALKIARTAIKTLELLAAGDMGDDQERIELMLKGIAGQFVWAAELLNESPGKRVFPSLENIAE